MNLKLYWRLYTKYSQNEFSAYMSDLKLWNSLKKKRQKCYDAVFVSDFLTMHQCIENRKMDNWFYCIISIVNQNTLCVGVKKKNPQEERKYSQIIKLMKFLISRVYGGLLKLNSKKTTLVQKMHKELAGILTIYEWLISSWNNDHHCSSLGNANQITMWYQPKQLLWWLILKQNRHRKYNNCWWRCEEILNLVHCCEMYLV